jgi:tRNA(adenine34) deaminase
MDMDTRVTDSQWMQQALALARKAAAADEVPVGASVVVDNKLLASGTNANRHGADPLAHAELTAIRAATEKLGSRYLTDCSLYVTLEPCCMCAGAIVLARVERLIFAASDPKAGACGSLYNIPQDARLNHRVEVTAGLLAEQAASLLSDFFKSQRALGKK